MNQKSQQTPAFLTSAFPRGKTAGKPRSPWHLYYNVPLAVRLERLGAALPSDDFCGAEAVTTLRQMLDITVETLWELNLRNEDDQEEIERSMEIYEMLDGAYEALDPGCTEWYGPTDPLSLHCTYRNVLRTVYDLRQKYLSERDTSYLDLAQEILRCVADRLLTFPDVSKYWDRCSSAPSPPPASETPCSDPEPGISLRTRLAGVRSRYSGDLDQLIRSYPRSCWNDIVRERIPCGQYPILALPVSDYFYAAARINRSAAPFQTARKDFEGFLDPNKGVLSFAILLMIAMGRFPKKDPTAVSEPPDDAFLYDLLVKPIFPDPRPRSGEHKK